MRHMRRGLAQVCDYAGRLRLRRVGVAMLGLAVVLALTSVVLAQVSANYDLSWHVIAGGGGRMESAGHTLRGTTGQPLVGPMSSGGHALHSGFWGRMVAAPKHRVHIYMPLVVRDLP
jgi:hypothetical protein